MRKCPYDAIVCKACDSVGDWTNIDNIIAANDMCKTEVHKFCSENPGHPKCACWNANNPYYKGACDSLRNLFAKNILKEEPPPKKEKDNIDDVARLIEALGKHNNNNNNNCKTECCKTDDSYCH